MWSLLTTREGLESWFGPEGFSVHVIKLELRSGGKRVCRLVTPDGGSSDACEDVFSEVTENRRLAFDTVIPGDHPLHTVIDLIPLEESTHLVATLSGEGLDRHEITWCTGQLQRIARVLSDVPRRRDQ